DRNRSHWSTSKTPSYTKSVSWQHHPQAKRVRNARVNVPGNWGKISNGKIPLIMHTPTVVIFMQPSLFMESVQLC
ncbi:hypothetical protein OFN71_04635, partial [Escherichia coli]|nr:hypothetical protein [Escherichia coli]